MSKILLVCAKADFGPRLQTALEEARAFVGEGHIVVDPASLDWAAVQRAEGGWDAGYRWAARAHDACIVLETESGSLARGTFELAQNFMKLEKRVGVLRGGKVTRVEALQKSLAADWKLDYGRALPAIPVSDDELR